MAEILTKANQNLKSDEIQNDSIEIPTKSISQKIDDVIQKCGALSTNSRDHASITHILFGLGELLNEFENVKNTITDQQSHQLYMQFHKFIKSQQAKDTKLSAASTTALQANDKAKLTMIKDEVVEMMQQAQVIYKQVFKESQKHVLWMDKKENNNVGELDILKKAYKDYVNIKYYIKDDEFRADILNLKDYPLILIMSASAAGSNIQFGDGDHLKYILSIKNELRLRGIIIFCGKKGEDSMRELANNPDNMICAVSVSKQTLLDNIERLIVPLDFKRVVPLQHLDYYLSKQLKDIILSWSLQDWTKFNLLDYKTKKFEKMFQKAKDMIVQKKINILVNVINSMETIPQSIEQIFEKNDTEEKLCFELMKFYSDEKNPCYQFLNSVLNIMNDDLIFKLMDFISIFLISLFKYNDQNCTIIQKPFTGERPDILPIYQFYRGTSIPTSFIKNDELIPGSYITLPSFSSFTPKLDQAMKFMIKQQRYGDCTLILLSYKFQTGTAYYDLRPKCIKEASKYKKEEEYLVFPFTSFCIKSVNPKQEKGANYLFVELNVN